MKFPDDLALALNALAFSVAFTLLLNWLFRHLARRAIAKREANTLRAMEEIKSEVERMKQEEENKKARRT
jgi:hypothetical protein